MLIMKTEKKPNYFLRFTRSWETIGEAESASKDLNQLYPLLPKNEIGYYIPQPQYKSWVPNWLIRLITK